MPDIVEQNEVAVASLVDLFGMKCATLPQRSETKDYLDIHALIFAGNVKADLLTAVKCVSLQTLPTVTVSQIIGEDIERTCQ